MENTTVNTFPNWHQPLHVPTIGDDVQILHIVTLPANAPTLLNFSVRVQPRTGTGMLSEHAQALSALLQTTHSATARFLDRYFRPNIEPNQIGKLRVELKNLLENYRSALDYVAHYLADRCTPKPDAKKVQFPVANENDTAATFGKKLDRWFPGLSTSVPNAKAHLLSIQQFNGDTWLNQLSELANFNKHHSLSPQECGRFESVVIRCGGSRIRLGELGLKSLTIEAGGALRFVNVAGEHVDLDGSQRLDATTTSITGSDSRIEVVREEHNLFRIPGQPESIAGTVWVIAKNVFRTVDKLCSMLT